MFSRLKIPFFKRRTQDESEVEELRIAFKARYHNFKLLLNANNRSLEIMAEMEEALQGIQPFGMTFIQALTTSVSTSVWQIIKQLNELAPGKYEKLYDRFKEIQKQINPLVYPKRSAQGGPLVLSFQDVDRNLADQVGSKIANLGEVKNQINLEVPNGFVITAQAYHQFMEYTDLQTEISRRLQTADMDRLDQLYSLSAAIQQLIIQAPLSGELETAIMEHYRQLVEKEGVRVTVAMRSSALGEDLAGTSFAGQYRSELNVSSENIINAYKEIVASKYSLPAVTYRLNRGIRDQDVAMCVGCMSMVDAVSGGVVYSQNPMDIHSHTTIINSVWGLPKSVVDGSTVPDLFIVSQNGPMEILYREIPVKERKFVCYPDEGVCRLEISGEEARMASLNDEQVLELARLATRLEEYYGVPQDIEWAVRPDGSFVVLQCRPLKETKREKVRDLKAVKEGVLGEVVFEGGVLASPGAAAGPAYIVKKDMDALQFPEGGILVAVQSLPRWAPLMNRAAAIITEQGSIAGHLATVAREFGVPALFGVKGAIDKLENGQVITVDTEDAKVYEGRVEALLERQKDPKNLMKDSPVFQTLEGAARLIVPLNLLDPDAPSFKPDNCNTFHDITRFCHEKAVQEMFQFGKEHRFPERSSKQLYYKVPMQWWILNLDDGFKEEIEGKYVKLENIDSIPMLALWEGFTAVPWAGPPPIDGKGFMSVMFQATTNRALAPGVRSNYGERNYFMISKNYCSLNSRLGFHFSTVETLVGDRPSENYVSFQYKGGAADFNRRLKRVTFLRDILEEHGFRVEVTKDNLIARVENHEKDFMKTALKIIGYLTIHTRQLDMIMSNEASVNYYRNKIEKDIRELLEPVAKTHEPHS
ncbi:MAG: pyruvate, water dikinase [Deltaproteobacteria bacterium]|nr:pyruvate, water dikinase [Deltaproteobacteria bacterium]